MRIVCEYCNNNIEDTDLNCPHCGSPNSHLVRSADGVPRTIDELKAYCEKKGLPLRQMRFFIGEDCKEARAFGIYKDNNENFVVYKNKSDGSRMVRYEGGDEAYAVNEIFQKLRNEVIDRKENGGINQGQNRRATMGNSQSLSGKKNKRDTFIFAFILIAILTFVIARCSIAFSTTPDAGYYLFNNNYYYNDYSVWYEYDGDQTGYTTTDCPDALSKNYSDYYLAPPNDSSREINPEVANTYPLYSKTIGTNTSTIVYDEDSGKYHYEKTENDDYGYDSDSGYSYDDNDSWDSSWDDDDWDYDYSGWDSNDTDWDTDW